QQRGDLRHHRLAVRQRDTHCTGLIAFIVTTTRDAQETDMPFIPVNGIELYYELHGDGPAVVFCHGAGGNHLSWWQQVPVFAKHFTCITYDSRAFGRSRDAEGGGRQWFWKDLAALLDHLGVERTAIVAQSMGGRTAVPFAMMNPGRAWAIVLAGTNGGAVTEEVRRLQDEYKASLPKGSTLNHRA